MTHEYNDINSKKGKRGLLPSSFEHFLPTTREMTARERLKDVAIGKYETASVLVDLNEHQDQ